MRRKPRLPCTGRTPTEGFADFLANELSGSRGNLRRLSEELAAITGDAKVTLVNSGSSANLAAAIWVKGRCGARRRILMSSFSFPTTIASYTLLGFEVRLVDTEPDGFNLDPEALAEAMDETVAAVVATHFLGLPAQMGRIERLARAKGALVIQDACETMNLTVDGVPIHRHGDLVTHSFYHPHHLSSYGGGLVAARDPAIHAEVESIVHWGRACSCHLDPASCAAPDGLNHNFWYIREGVNLELSELNACFARWQLRTWPSQEARRWEHWRRWERALAGIPGVRTWTARQDVSPFVFPVGVPAGRHAAVTAAIQEAGVEIRSLMGGAIHRHPAYAHLAHGGLANSEATGGSCFFVGIHQTLADTQVEEACGIVSRILRQA